jgi:predicted DNA-binding WGR domain protein
MVFSLTLHAINPEQNCRRRYRLEVERDLLGDWLVRLTFGRIGSAGRSMVALAEDEQHAQRVVGAILRRRATAPRRIGVRYRPVAHFAGEGWEELEKLLEARTT